jgi:hypothetical protein
MVPPTKANIFRMRAGQANRVDCACEIRFLAQGFSDGPRSINREARVGAPNVGLSARSGGIAEVAERPNKATLLASPTQARGRVIGRTIRRCQTGTSSLCFVRASLSVILAIRAMTEIQAPHHRKAAGLSTIHFPPVISSTVPVSGLPLAAEPRTRKFLPPPIGLSKDQDRALYEHALHPAVLVEYRWIASYPVRISRRCGLPAPVFESRHDENGRDTAYIDCLVRAARLGKDRVG